MGQDRGTLGQYLKKSRESLLTPVQEIAKAIGVEKSLIEALENDDYNLFSQYIQAKAALRQYCAYLKLNESESLRQFELQWRLMSHQREFPKLSSFTETEEELPRISKQKGSWDFKSFTTWRLPNLPSLREIPHIPQMRLRWPLIFIILLTGLFLLVDLPFTKQKPPPPEDPRFAELNRRATTLEVSAIPAPAREIKQEVRPEPIAPAQENIPRIAASQENISSAQKNGKVVGNSDTKRYHLPGMKFYNKIREHHRVVFQSEKEAIHAGYHKARD
ncbi:MAG: helix-turn-helix domain-containing protein [Syntrophales bacterium]|nr:helix-turn-helix domain-containing protein [Syntrophales bacterium]